MKIQVVLLSLVFGTVVMASTTINSSHKYAYSGNTGWINAQGDGANGAVIGRFFCSGNMYFANCGWISLGAGTPTNGYAFGNTAANDYGVNHDGHGNLSGYAYGANIGWVTFEQTYGKPKVDLNTGNLSGYVWSANVGWIALTNTQAYVQTDSLDDGPDSDGDGLPDAWEYQVAGDLATLDGASDSDGDGATDADEYQADTNPQNGSDRLLITALDVDGSTNNVTWTVKTTRRYTLQKTDALSNTSVWTVASPSFIPAAGPAATRIVTGVNSATARFYRVQAELPLE